MVSCHDDTSAQLTTIRGARCGETRGASETMRGGASRACHVSAFAQAVCACVGSACMHGIPHDDTRRAVRGVRERRGDAARCRGGALRSASDDSKTVTR